jgi:hypothetical protein
LAECPLDPINDRRGHLAKICVAVSITVLKTGV